jgi:two-component system, OmpR family, sensor kinase
MKIRSIRLRLALWYGGILLAALVGFGAILYSRQAWTTWDRVDRQLSSAVTYLDVALRGFPPEHKEGPPEWDGPPPDFDGPPPFGPPPWKKKGFPKKDRPPPGQHPGEHPPPDVDLPDSMREPGEHEEQRLRYVIWRPDGSVLKATPGMESIKMPDVPNEMQWGTGNANRQITMRGPFSTTILVRRSVALEQGELTRFLGLIVAAGLGVLVVGLVGGWFLSGRIVRPLGTIAETASKISALHLDQRLETASLDSELVDLARVLNEMFARLETEFERQARFTADSSHELRTPLAVLLGNVDLALSRPRTPEEYQSTLRSCREAATRMRSLIDGLLTLARADANRLEMQRANIDLRTVVRDAQDTFAPQAERSNIRLLAEWPDTPVRIIGDRVFLGRVLANLIQNALRYTPSGGAVRILVAVEGREAIVQVRDTGCGIAAEHHIRIFERFYRVDADRARETGGCGLGLAICKSTVQQHGGTLAVDSTPGEGTMFTVRLPLA